MSDATVIDQLIVKLGLDPDDFEKGRKEAARGVLDLERGVKKSSAGMSASVLGFAKKLLGIAGVALTVKKGLDFMSGLSVSVRQLGIDSRNFGVAANEMRNFQNISEMMGGKAEDATKTIGNLTKAVYDLAYNGQMSDSLVMLARMGVQFQDTAGNARSFKDIVLSTQSAVQSMMKNGTSRANANQMLLQAGFDPGLAQAILAGNVSQQLAQQRARRQVGSAAVNAATEWEKSATNRDQAIKAAALRALPAQAAAGTYTNEKLAQGAEGLSNATLTSLSSDLGGMMTQLGEGIKTGGGKVIDAFEDLAARTARAAEPKGRGAYEQTIQSAAKQYGIDPEMLAGIITQETNFDPTATGANGAVGVAGLRPKNFPKVGRSANADIYRAARYIRQLHDAYKKQGMSDDSAYYQVYKNYDAQQANVTGPFDTLAPMGAAEHAKRVRDVASGAIPTPTAGRYGGGQAGSVTNIHFRKVDVNTQATDANGIARDFSGAVKRKFNAANADIGMQ